MNVYFDNAATSWPKPPAVYEAVNFFMKDIGASPGRSGHQQAMEANRVVYSARCSLAAMLNAPSEDNIIFTLNATDGLNMAIKGMVEPGDHIITSSLEHNSVMRPLIGLQDRGLIELSVIPFDSVLGMDPDAVRLEIRDNTRCVVMTHASNVSGMVLPVAEVGQIAENAGVSLVVDGAQTAGAFPVDVQSLKADIFAFTGHKGLLGPQGTGGIYIRDNLCLKPWREGGTGSLSSSDRQPDFLPDALEAGTPNTPGIAGLLAAVEYITALGVEKINGQELVLRSALWNGLMEIPRVHVCSPAPSARTVGVVSFTVEGLDPGQVGAVLDHQYNIACRTGLHCAPQAHRALGTYPEGTIRFSFGIFNTVEEVRYAVNAVKKLIEN